MGFVEASMVPLWATKTTKKDVANVGWGAVGGRKNTWPKKKLTRKEQSTMDKHFHAQDLMMEGRHASR